MPGQRCTQARIAANMEYLLIPTFNITPLIPSNTRQAQHNNSRAPSDPLHRPLVQTLIPLSTPKSRQSIEARPFHIPPTARIGPSVLSHRPLRAVAPRPYAPRQPSTVHQTRRYTTLRDSSGHSLPRGWCPNTPDRFTADRFLERNQTARDC